MIDIVNAAFEVGGGVMAVMNLRALIRSKSVRGVYWPATALFSAWGWWNVYYYPALGQYLSAAAGLTIAALNTAWVVLAIRYRKG